MNWNRGFVCDAITICKNKFSFSLINESLIFFSYRNSSLENSSSEYWVGLRLAERIPDSSDCRVG